MFLITLTVPSVSPYGHYGPVAFANIKQTSRIVVESFSNRRRCWLLVREAMSVQLDLCPVVPNGNWPPETDDRRTTPEAGVHVFPDPLDRTCFVKCRTLELSLSFSFPFLFNSFMTVV